MNIHPVGAQLFEVNRCTGGQTDMKKLTAPFCNFLNMPKTAY